MSDLRPATNQLIGSSIFRRMALPALISIAAAMKIIGFTHGDISAIALVINHPNLWAMLASVLIPNLSIILAAFGLVFIIAMRLSQGLSKTNETLIEWAYYLAFVGSVIFQRSNEFWLIPALIALILAYIARKNRVFRHYVIAPLRRLTKNINIPYTAGMILIPSLFFSSPAWYSEVRLTKNSGDVYQGYLIDDSQNKVSIIEIKTFKPIYISSLDIKSLSYCQNLGNVTPMFEEKPKIHKSLEC